jgi:hypothetical protein
MYLSKCHLIPAKKQDAPNKGAGKIRQTGNSQTEYKSFRLLYPNNYISGYCFGLA